MPRLYERLTLEASARELTCCEGVLRVSADNIALVTSIAGKINGAEFTASGEGIADGHGTSRSNLQFSRRIPKFTPMLCKSWQCKHHATVASLESGEANPLAKFLDEGGVILDRTDVEYPQSFGRIVMTSHLSRPEPGKQDLFQTRLGEYRGPDDIVRQLPFDFVVTLMGPGRARGKSIREVLRADGETIAME